MNSKNLSEIALNKPTHHILDIFPLFALLILVLIPLMLQDYVLYIVTIPTMAFCYSLVDSINRNAEAIDQHNAKLDESNSKIK